MTLFHIATRHDWEEAKACGVYRPASLESLGFIPLAGDRQWLEVAHRLYPGRSDLVLLTVRDDHGDVRWEEAAGELHPHLYGPLDVGSVVEAFDLPSDGDRIPPELRPWRAYMEPLRMVITPPSAFVASMLETDPHTEAVVICGARDHGRIKRWVVLGAKPGYEGGLELGKLMKAAASLPAEARAELPGRCGWMQLGRFPRREDGAIDDDALLSLVESEIEDD